MFSRMSKTAATFEDYEKALLMRMRRCTELAQVRGRLNALMTAFDERGSLGILQVMAADQSLSAETRIRAASAAVPYERPKLSVTATTTVPLYDLLEEHRRKAKVIEHEPKPAA